MQNAWQHDYGGVQKESLSFPQKEVLKTQRCLVDADCTSGTSSEPVKGCLVFIEAGQISRMYTRRLRTVRATGSSGELIDWAAQVASKSRHRPGAKLGLAPKVPGSQTLLP